MTDGQVLALVVLLLLAGPFYVFVLGRSWGAGKVSGELNSLRQWFGGNDKEGRDG